MAKGPDPRNKDRWEPQFASSWRKTAGGRNNRRRRAAAAAQKEKEKEQTKTYPASIQIAVAGVAVLLLVLLGISLWTFRPKTEPSSETPSVSKAARSDAAPGNRSKPRAGQARQKDPAGWGRLPEGDDLFTKDGRPRYRNVEYIEEEPEEEDEEDRPKAPARAPIGDGAEIDYE